MHVAIFGGSFNPPHIGHVLCAVYAHCMGGADAVWAFPVAEHPYGKPLASWEDRWALCEAAFADLPFVELRDDEQRNPGNRTVTLIQALRERHPEHRFSLIGGTDTEQDLGNWYRGEELRELVDILAVPRRGYDDAHPAALPAISSTQVRERLATGATVDDLVPRAVARVLAERQPYPAPAT